MSIKSSVIRYTGKYSLMKLLLLYLFGEGFKVIFWLRTYQALRGIPFLRGVVKIIYLRISRKYGIGISLDSRIGEGLYISHFTGIFIHPSVSMGRNCNLNQGVTIGRKESGTRGPRIGSEVYFGPGSKIIGDIEIGDCVVIGANAVVTKNVRSHTVIAGVPARPLRTITVNPYINNRV